MGPLSAIAVALGALAAGQLSQGVTSAPPVSDSAAIPSPPAPPAAPSAKPSAVPAGPPVSPAAPSPGAAPAALPGAASEKAAEKGAEAGKGQSVPAGAAPSAAAPGGTQPPDRIRTSEGREHVGRIIRELDNAFDFEDTRGARYAIPFYLVVEIERAGKNVYAARSQAAALPVPEPEPQLKLIRQKLDLTFDIVSIEKERKALTYSEKILVGATGLAMAVVGFVAVKGETGTGIGAVGSVLALGGGAAVGITAIRDSGLEHRAEEARGRLSALEARSERAAPASPLAFAW